MSLHPAFPQVEPHPEILEWIDCLRSGRVGVEATFRALRAVVVPYLWDGASFRHADLVGAAVWAKTRGREDVPQISSAIVRQWESLHDEPRAETAPEQAVMSILTSVFLERGNEFFDVLRQFSEFYRERQFLPARNLI